MRMHYTAEARRKREIARRARTCLLIIGRLARASVQCERL